MNSKLTVENYKIRLFLWRANSDLWSHKAYLTHELLFFTSCANIFFHFYCSTSAQYDVKTSTLLPGTVRYSSTNVRKTRVFNALLILTQTLKQRILMNISGWFTDKQRQCKIVLINRK